jgi:hypothetical protein
MKEHTRKLLDKARDAIEGRKQSLIWTKQISRLGAPITQCSKLPKRYLARRDCNSASMVR